MFGYFDGDFRRRPQQSLGGAHKETQRQQLLERAAQERRHREEQRRRINCSVIIQSFIRGCLVRKRLYSQFRHEFDEIKKNYSVPTNDAIERLIHNFIIFYSVEKDAQRLNWLSQLLVKEKNSIARNVVNDTNHWLYRIKCILNFNLTHLESTVSQNTSIAIPLRLLEVYTLGQTYQTEADPQKIDAILSSIWNYLISKHFFKQMRNIIESKTPEPYESTARAPTPLAATLLDLILRPLKTIKANNQKNSNLIIGCFLNETLKGPLSPQIKDFVLTHLTTESNDYIKAQYIIDCLLPQYCPQNINISLPPNIWLFYCILKLIGVQTTKIDTEYIIKYLHILRSLSISLSEVRNSSIGSDSDGEDNEPMDTNVNSEPVSIANNSSLVDELIRLLNESTHVSLITSLIDNEQVMSEPQTLISLSCLCHSLLSTNPMAVNQYRLLYTLAFKSQFLRLLWKYITSVSTPSVFGSPTSLLYILSRGLPLAAVQWHQILPQLTLFCALFSYLFPTLDDVEFYRDVESDFETMNTNFSTMPFTLQELVSMGSTLRDVCVGLVELAYHDTRPSVRHDYQNALKSVDPNVPQIHTMNEQKDITRHWMKLFQSCVKLLRQLHARDSRRQFCPPDHWISKQVVIPVERPTNFRLGIRQRQSMYREFMGLRHLTREELEEHGPPLSTSEVRNVTVLQEIPFVVSFLDRFKILQTLIAIDRTQQRGDPNTFNVLGNTIQIVIRRNYIYEDAFDKLSPENEPNLKQALRVQLVSSIGVDEVGIDGGGIFREFLSEVLKTAFDPNRGFFRSTSDSLLYPNPSVSLIVDNYVKHYYFIGRMLGKAIYENMLVELPFAPFFLAKLLARHSGSDIEIHHLASLDPLMYKNLIFLKSYEGDVSELGLDFTVLNNDLGTTQVIELKPNGAKIPVTAQNRIEYIHLMADYRLNKQIRSQCSAFKSGLADVLDGSLDWLRMFDPRELQILISGAPTPIDIEDLKNHTNYGGGYNKEHKIIVIFWKVVEKFDENERRKLLKFVTSCSRPPLLGFKDLFPAFCIQNAGREANRLPTASTCMNLLKLPEIEDFQTMKQKLKYAIDSGAGFELS